MEKYKLNLIILVLGILISGSSLQAQNKAEKSKEETEKVKLEKMLQEEQMLREKELQKVLESNKALQEYEIQKILEASKQAQSEKIRDYEMAMEQYHKNMERGTIAVPEFRFKTWPEGSDWIYGNDAYPAFDGMFYQNESSSLNIQKNVKDLTFSTQFNYNVAEGSRSLSFSANGSVEKGTIKIRLLDQSGKLVHEMEISPLADVNWNQSLRWDDEESVSKIGAWKIEVAAQDATGKYTVSARAR